MQETTMAQGRKAVALLLDAMTEDLTVLVDHHQITGDMADLLCGELGMDEDGEPEHVREVRRECIAEMLCHVGLEDADITDAVREALLGLAMGAAGKIVEQLPMLRLPPHATGPAEEVRAAALGKAREAETMSHGHPIAGREAIEIYLRDPQGKVLCRMNTGDVLDVGQAWEAIEDDPGAVYVAVKIKPSPMMRAAVEAASR